MRENDEQECRCSESRVYVLNCRVKMRRRRVYVLNYRWRLRKRRV